MVSALVGEMRPTLTAQSVLLTFGRLRHIWSKRLTAACASRRLQPYTARTLRVLIAIAIRIRLSGGSCVIEHCASLSFPLITFSNQWFTFFPEYDGLKYYSNRKNLKMGLMGTPDYSYSQPLLVPGMRIGSA